MKPTLAWLFWLTLVAQVSCTGDNSSSDPQSLIAEWSAQQHSFANLSAGRTHYEDRGDPNRPTVVMVHGVSGPMTAWDEVMPRLADLRFRGIRYDLYGRGFSERLDVDHDLNLYVKQLADLVADRQVRKPFTLVASSFGSVIATEFANRFGPAVVNAVVLIGPAGFPIEVPFIAKLRDVPILGNILFSLAGESTIIEQNEKYFVDDAVKAKHMPYFTAQLKIEGSAEAILSTMRHSPVQNYVDGFTKFGATKIPLFVVWGTDDATFPYENHKILQKAVPYMRLHTVNNSAHLPQYERPEQCVEWILNFIVNEAK